MTINDDNCHWEDSSPNRVASDDSKRFNEILIALANTHRRRVLQYMQEKRRSSLSNVAQQLAAWEQDIPPADVLDEARDELKTVLYHKHLSKLQDLYLIEYDRRSEKLVFRGPPEFAERRLEYCASVDLPT